MLIFPHKHVMKPPVGAQIDWGHPLAQALVFCVFPGGEWRKDLVSNADGTLLTSGSWAGVTPNGSALQSTSNTNGGAYWPWNDRLTVGNSYSLVIRLNPTTLAGWDYLFNIPYSNTYVSPYYSLAMLRNGTGSDVYWAFSASGAGVSVGSGNGFVASTNGLTTYAATRTGTAAVFYRNGLQFSTGTFGGSGAPTFPNKIGPVIMNRNQTDNGNGPQGMCEFVGLWNRTLTAVEMQAVHEQPFAMLYVPRRWWVARGTIYSRGLSRSGSIAASVSRAAIYPRTASRTGIVSPTLTKTRTFSRAPSRTGSVSASVSRTGIFGRAVSRTGSIAASVARAGIYPRAVSRTGSVSASVSRVKLFGRSLSFAGSVAATLARTASFGRHIVRSGSVSASVSTGQAAAAGDNLNWRLVQAFLRAEQFLIEKLHHPRSSSSGRGS